VDAADLTLPGQAICITPSACTSESRFEVSGTTCICSTAFPTWTPNGSNEYGGTCEPLPDCSAIYNYYTGNFIVKTDSCVCPANTEEKEVVSGSGNKGCLVACGVHEERITNSHEC
jgi:hypothetical protein